MRVNSVEGAIKGGSDVAGQTPAHWESRLWPVAGDFPRELQNRGTRSLNLALARNQRRGQVSIPKTLLRTRLLAVGARARFFREDFSTRSEQAWLAPWKAAR